MHFDKWMATALVSALAPAWAAMYQGMVKESRFGMGVDSVKVTLKSGSTVAYTDSTGRFSLLTAAIHPRETSNPEVLWFGRSRILEWSAVKGPISVIIADAAGKTLHRFSVPAGGTGHYQTPGLPAGIYFTAVHAMGRKLSWRWNAAGSEPGTPGAALPPSPDRAFSLASAAVYGALAKAAATDSLIFERKGFATTSQALTGSDAAMEVKLAREPIKVLIVDGMSNHYWEQTTKIVRAVYALGGFFAVDVTTAPKVAGASVWDAWKPDFTKYEVVLMNYNSGDASGSLNWPADKRALLEEFVKGGGGLYVLHAANNSFPDWPEYNKMIATGWRPSAFGSALKVETDLRITLIPPGTGGGTSHGNRADAPIRILQRHPINKGYPDAYLASTLEIYQYARGPAANCKVLSYAYDGPASGNSKINWPIEILIDYGKGQVYNATPGHVWAGESMPNAVRDVSFQTTLIRATEWLARKEVLYPVPAVFNTETKVVFRDLILN
ncbi:MAG: ThuA domain-containing protein [Fibrobacteria bacterium]